MNNVRVNATWTDFPPKLSWWKYFFFHFISFLLWNYLKWSVVVYHVCICVSILYFFFYENLLLLRQFILDNWCEIGVRFFLCHLSYSVSVLIKDCQNKNKLQPLYILWSQKQIYSIHTWEKEQLTFQLLKNVTRNPTGKYLLQLSKTQA